MPTSNVFSRKARTTGGITWLFLLCLALVISPQTAPHAGVGDIVGIGIPLVGVESPLPTVGELDGSKLLSDEEYFEATVKELQRELTASSKEMQAAIDNINKELNL